jgi:HEAT repeat protein
MLRKRLLRLGLYGTLGLFVVVVAANPFLRQMLFGPTIEDVPLCYWQDTLRHFADPGAGRDSLTRKALNWLGYRGNLGLIGRPDSEADQLMLLLSLVDDPHPPVRASVANGLDWHIKADGSLAALRRLLDDPVPSVRAAAARSLARHPAAASESLPRLEQLLDDPDPECRLEAAFAVWQAGRKKHPGIPTALRQGLSDTNFRTRLSAVEYAGLLGKASIEILPELADCALNDSSNLVRHRCIHMLAKIGRPAVPTLAAVLRGPDAAHREIAANALGDLGPDAAAAVPDLQRLLGHPDPIMHSIALNALRRIDPEQYPAPKAEPE